MAEKTSANHPNRTRSCDRNGIVALRSNHVNRAEGGGIVDDRCPVGDNQKIGGASIADEYVTLIAPDGPVSGNCDHIADISVEAHCAAIGYQLGTV